MCSIINVKNLSFKYPSTERYVFKNINFNILESNINLLLGSSGCGKSTLINCLAGLIPNSIEGKLQGEILYKGQDIVGKMPYEICDKIGIVFQDADSQFCTFTVEDEIAFGLENMKLPKEEIDERISKVLNLVGIIELRKRILNTLSGGEKQKVAIASVLALEPECIILDEPTANLDPKSTLEIFKLLGYLKEKEHKTILVIEHKVDDIIEFIDNLILLDKVNECIIADTPQKVINKVSEDLNNLPLWIPEVTKVAKKLKSKGICCENFYKKAQAVKHFSDLCNLFHKYDEINYINKNEKTKLKIENLKFSHNRNKKVLNNVNIEVKEGDCIALLGCNGAGKSTLSKLVLGLYKDYTGGIYINNKELRNFKRQELNREIGLVFQNPEHQFVANTVYDELAYSLRVNNVDEKTVDEKVKENLHKFNLSEFKQYNPYLLSQGQKRRLSVASMLITGQNILILDEPTFGQDGENTIELMEYIKGVNENGVTIIIITHDMNLVASYCNRAVVLNEGHAVFDGSIKELFLNNDLLDDANLKVPIISEICIEVKKTHDNFPLFFNIKSFIKALDEVKANDCI